MVMVGVPIVQSKKKNEAPRLVAGVRKRVILRRPALKALSFIPNLSLNVSDALRATRAESGTTCHCLAHLRRVTNIHGDIIVSNANTAAVGELCTV